MKPAHSAQTRKQLIVSFLNNTPWQQANREAMQQDASFRRYFRLTRRDGTTAILMDAPPPERPVADFANIADHLKMLGLRAPACIKIDNTAGLLLLEDLGDTTFTRALATGEDETTLYSQAIDELIKLHQHPQATDIDIATYDQPTLDREAGLLCDWFYPEVIPICLEEAAKSAYFSTWHELYENINYPLQSLVLRDFHIDNLMVVKDATSCAVLDFQDALIGSPAYDLVSLLEDARRDISTPLVKAMLDRYFSARPEIDKPALMQDYITLGVHRHCKVAGIFIRLHQRDNKPHYLHHIPRVIKLLQSGLQAPHLHSLKTWFDTYLPLNNIDIDRFKVS